MKRKESSVLTWLLNLNASNSIFSDMQHFRSSKVCWKGIMEQYSPMDRQEQEKPIQCKEITPHKGKEALFLGHLSTFTRQ